MSAQDLARAIEALADDEVREAVVAGDRSAFAGLELTEAEVADLEAAAGEYPEVAGFAFGIGTFGLGVDGESTDDRHKGEIEMPAPTIHGVPGLGALPKGFGLPGGNRPK